MSVDVSLVDKEAFYAQLGWLDAASDVEEEIPPQDCIMRAKDRDFFKQIPAKKSTRASAHKPTATPDDSLDMNFRRSRTAQTPRTAHSTVIEATPAGQDCSKQAPNRLQLPVSNSFVEETPLQQSRPSGVAKLKHNATNPLSVPTLSKAPSPRSFSLSKTGRRKCKRAAEIPENSRLLKGLWFFYIPGDRKSLRRSRMEQAEKYGATVTRTLSDATHIIVDDSLTFDDIKLTLTPMVDQAKPLVVREHWPIDSIAEKRLLPTSSLRYRVKGFPAAEGLVLSVAEKAAATHTPGGSLEIKDSRKNQNNLDYVLHLTLSQSEDSSAPKQPSGEAPHAIPPTHLPEIGLGMTTAHAAIPSSQAPSGDEVSCASPMQSRRTDIDCGDELSQLINDVQKKYKDLPSLAADDDDESRSDDKRGTTSADGDGECTQSDSEGERQAKRLKKPNKSDLRFEDKFACSRGGTKDQGSSAGNLNARTIAVLQQMLDYYTRTNDHWRIQAYRKGIETLSRQPDKVTTAEEAIKLPFIGKRLGQKIEEIVDTDRLQRLEQAQNNATSHVLKLFLGIYGVGMAIADKWIAQGFRTLDDLVQRAALTSNQCVGVEHYEDLNTRIPRSEVRALADYVKDEAARVDKDVELLIGGSYRRGADSSGDIDLIITKAGTKTSEELNPFLDSLVFILTQKGFLTAELASHNYRAGRHHEDGNGSKWHGCCVLPRTTGSEPHIDGHVPWRRIDFLLVPETEYGAALIYFTGNDIFNRSLRLLASRKGMRLNQRGLYKDTIRGLRRQRFTEGELLEGKSEKKIFEILGVKWRQPQERWC